MSAEWKGALETLNANLCSGNNRIGHHCLHSRLSLPITRAGPCRLLKWERGRETTKRWRTPARVLKLASLCWKPPVRINPPVRHHMSLPSGEAGEQMRVLHILLWPDSVETDGGDTTVINGEVWVNKVESSPGYGDTSPLVRFWNNFHYPVTVFPGKCIWPHCLQSLGHGWRKFYLIENFVLSLDWQPVTEILSWYLLNVLRLLIFALHIPCSRRGQGV